MAKKFVLTVLLANLVTSNCQLGELTEDNTDDQTTNGGNPSYSFSYGVSDARTGDIKTVWETKEGDTVKGHYSVMEPDGSMRTVEYSAAPDTGFKAVVNSESATPKAIGSARSIIEEKAMRDYEKYYDYSEDEEDYIDRRRTRRPHDQHAEHSRRKPQYPDLEPSEYTHSISIKHPYDESIFDSEPHSHVGYSFDPNCKTKHKKESHEHRDNSYGNFADLDLNKHKYPAIFSPDPFKESYNNFAEPSGFDSEKQVKFSYNDNFKKTKFDDMNIKPASSMKYNYPVLPELSPPDRYENDDYHPPRPKKKRPHKQPDYHYSGEDNDEYVLVPKKKYKPTRPVESTDYRPDVDDDYERPHYNDEDDHDDRYRNPPRNSKPKEVVRKIVKKRRPPVINLLDIFDI